MAAAAILQGVGGTLGAYGALQSGADTASLLDSQAEIQRKNATVALTAAKFNADRSSVMATKHLGAMTAGYGASGVDMSSGSVLAVMGASAANAELDRLNILHGGDVRAVNYENQASLDELGAKHSMTASYFNAAASLVGAGGRMMSTTYGSNGVPGGDNTIAGNEIDAGDSVGEGSTAYGYAGRYPTMPMPNPSDAFKSLYDRGTNPNAPYQDFWAGPGAVG